MKKLRQTIAFLYAFLGISQLPIENGKSNFSDEQLEKMRDKLGEEITDNVVAAIDKEALRILTEQQDNTELAAIREELQLALTDTNMTEEEVIERVQENREANAKSESSEDISLAAEVRNLAAQLIKANKNQDKLIQQLINDPEGDSPDVVGEIKRESKVKHSKTHLFSSSKAYDSFEGRPWNQRAAGLREKPTDFASSTGIELTKLNEDLDHYYRENPEVIRSLHRDRFGLPSYWKKKTNVTDQVADATIVTGEITQARKLGWLPKNKQRINAEIGKIFPVQIDIEFIGKLLQDLETTWLSKIVGGGSGPYKESFVGFLVSELDKKARVEDRRCSILGVYVETDDNATVPGRAINRQDGLLILLYRAYYLDKKFQSANIGKPTKTNILDYVNDMVEKNIPEEVRNEAGLVLNLSPDWLRAYKNRYRAVHGLEMDFDGTTWKIPNYHNIRFEPLVDLEGTDFMFITFDDNIEILENIPAEKSLYRFDRLKRDTYIYADYKLGIRMIHIGNKVSPTDPDAFKVQTVWTNNQPMFPSNFFVPIKKAAAGELALPYAKVVADDDFNDDITKLNGTYAGQIVEIKGNTEVSKLVKHDGDNITLTGGADFALSSGGTLTLYIDENLKATELARTTTPEVVAEEIISFDATTTVIDANEGSEFHYIGTDEDNTLEAIINGIEGQIITFVNKSASKSLIIDKDSTENVVAGSTKTLTENQSAKYIQHGGKFILLP